MGSSTEPGEVRENRTTDPPSGSQLLRLARGFATLFWGIPVCLLLFSNTITLQLSTRMQFPTYLVGVVFLYTGVLILYFAGPVTPRWQTRVRGLMFVLLLQVYFAPFVYWWQHAPQNPYFLVNTLGLVFCAMWSLLLTARLAGEACSALNAPALASEANIAQWAALLLMLMPFTVLFFMTFMTTVHAHGFFYIEWLRSLRRVPNWAMAAALVPVPLTMLVCWKIKERCMQQLKTGWDNQR